MAKFRRVEAFFREACLQAGYAEIRTPTIEYLHLFTATGTLTPGMLRRVYSFLDWDGWSGERVVLKPDATIPAARLYLERMAQEKPARLFYVTNTFVFEETGSKARERWQCGAELIGAGSPLGDADLVALALAALGKLGITDLNLKLSHAGLIRAALAGLGISAEEQRVLFARILDLGVEALKEVKTASPQGLEAMKLLCDTQGESSGYLKNLRALAPSASPDYRVALDDFICSFELIEALGVPCRIDMTAGKGFEYYTGLIFRLYAGEDNLGGGGRYDQLISVLGGDNTPAAGFALYMDHLITLMPKGETLSPCVTVACLPANFKVGVALIMAIRDAGLPARLALGEACPSEGMVEVEAEERFITTNMTGEKTVCSNALEVTKWLQV
jgi:histidyl-tRNA synthetase